jgi:hypothetical protein
MRAAQDLTQSKFGEEQQNNVVLRALHGAQTGEIAQRGKYEESKEQRISEALDQERERSQALKNIINPPLPSQGIGMMGTGLENINLQFLGAGLGTTDPQLENISKAANLTPQQAAMLWFLPETHRATVAAQMVKPVIPKEFAPIAYYDRASKEQRMISPTDPLILEDQKNLEEELQKYNSFKTQKEKDDYGFPGPRFIPQKLGEEWTGMMVDKNTGEHKQFRKGIEPIPPNFVDVSELNIVTRGEQAKDLKQTPGAGTAKEETTAAYSKRYVATRAKVDTEFRKDPSRVAEPFNNPEKFNADVEAETERRMNVTPETAKPGKQAGGRESGKPTFTIKGVK